MVKGHVLVRSAALAALALGGWVHADVTTAPDASTVPPAESTVQAAPPKPLMGLFANTPVGKALADAKTNVGGFVEASYTWNTSNPASNTNFGRVFDFEDQDFTLNQADVFIERIPDVGPGKFDVGFRAEMIYGGDSRAIHSLGLFDHYGFYNVPVADDADSPDNQFDLNQAYVDLSLPIGSGLKIRAGKFVTLLGYEVINPTGNAFYSHSFIFGYAIPFTNTGVLGTYNINDNLQITAGISRGWDTSTEDDNDTIDYTGQVSWTIDKDTHLIFNGITGPDQPGDNGNWRTVFDVIYTKNINDKLSVAVNGDYGYEVNSHTSTSGSDAQWYGIAGYMSFKLSDEATFSVRAEYFNDQDGARMFVGQPGGGQIAAITAGFKFTPFASNDFLSNFVIRPEVRWDYSPDKTPFDDGGSSHQFTAAVDAYFTF